MRKSIKSLLLLIILLFTFTKNVNAFEIGDQYNLINVGMGAYISFKGELSGTYNAFNYKAVNGSDVHAAFCLDPGFPNSAYVEVKRQLMDTKNHMARDWGLIAIMKQTPYNEPNNANFIATEHAVRMYIDVFADWVNPNFYATDDAKLHYNKVRAYAGTVYKLLKSSDELASAYTNITGNKIDYILTRFAIKEDNIPYFEGGDIFYALDILKIGINAANNFNKDGTSTPAIDFGSYSVNKTDEENQKLAVVELILSNISSFDPHTITLKKGLNVNDATFIGVSDFESSNMEDFEDTNSLESPDTKTTFYLGYLIDHNVPGEDEAPINASIDLSFKVEGDEFISGAILQPIASSGGVQRFAVYEMGSDSGDLTVSLDAQPQGTSDEPCEPEFNLPPICEDNIGELNEDKTISYSFKEGVVEDGTSIYACIVENTDLALNDYKLIDDRAEVVSDNPYCAVYCKEDYNFSVPYKINVDNGRFFRIRTGLKGQQDCYLSKMNDKQFNSDVGEAQKAIVEAYNNWQEYYELAHADDDGKLLTDYSDGYTYYNSYCTFGVEDDEDEDAEPTTSCNTDGGSTYYNKYVNFTETYYRYSNGNVTPDGDKPERTFYNTIKKYRYLNIRVNGQGGINSSSDGGKSINNPVVKIGVGGVCLTNCDTDDDGWPDLNIDYNGDGEVDIKTLDKDDTLTGYVVYVVSETALEKYTKLKPTFEGLEKAYRNELKAAVEELNKVVDQYNSCMDDDSYVAYSATYKDNHTWDMIYDYDPEIKYTYDEPDPTNIDIPKWINEVQAINADIMEPVQGDDADVPPEYVYAGDCDESAEDGICKETDTVELIFGGESHVKEYCKYGDLDKETYECSTEISEATYVDKNYFSCEITDTEVNCGSTPYKVTDLSYLHKVAVAGGTYDTPRVYYSYHTDGSVVISEEYPTDHEGRNYDKVEGLPVGINTPFGTYLYVLSFNNIGKYYNTGELGRIYGDNSTSLVMNVKETTETIDGFVVNQNQYACTYDTPSETTEPDKWCIMNDDKYYVCPENVFDEVECEEKSSKEAALEDTTYHEGCDGITDTPEKWCVKYNNSYYVCPNDVYTDDCVDFITKEAAMAASTYHSGCYDEYRWCIKHNGSYYSCTQDAYSSNPEICTEYTSKTAAIEASYFHYGCDDNSITWCIKHDNNYYVCTQDSYSSDTNICKQRTKDEAISESDYYDECIDNGTTWCIKYNNNYYVCTQDAYSSDSKICQKQINKETAIDKSDYDDGCNDNVLKWCIKKGSKYYVCTQDSYTSDKNICKERTKDEAIGESNYYDDCLDGGFKWCIKHNTKYYVCTQDSYSNDLEICTEFVSKEAAIKASYYTDQCVDKGNSWCVINNNKYYSCNQKTYSSDSKKCQEYSTKEAARNASDYKDGCPYTWCVKHGEDYYSCKSNKYSSKNGDCVKYSSVESALLATDFETEDCVTPPPPPSTKWCLKSGSAYYVCSTKVFNSDPNICTQYKDKDKALAAVGCSSGEDCIYDINCSSTCPKCTVNCFGTCIQKVTKEEDKEVKFNLQYRFNAVTPAKVNINDREMGYNWDVNNPKNVLIARKAANTITEIEARANVTNVSNPVELQQVEDYDFKVKLTPAVATWVREYNRSEQNNGSYNNDTIDCYDYEIESGSGFNSKDACEKAGYTWKDETCVMTNIFCYSKFIDQLIDEHPEAFDDENNDTVYRRSNAKTASFSNYTSYTALPHTEAPIITNDYWTIYVYDKLDVNGDGIPDIGPSWK